MPINKIHAFGKIIHSMSVFALPRRTNEIEKRENVLVMEFQKSLD